MIKNEDLLRSVREMGVTTHANDKYDVFRRNLLDCANVPISEEFGEPFNSVPTDQMVNEPWICEQWEEEDWLDEDPQRDLPDEDCFEYYAWYRSYHFEPQHKWGIYIRTKGVQKLARRLTAIRRAASTKQQGIIDSRIWAYKLLLAHEHYHYFVDVAATTLEEILYLARCPRPVFLDYFHHVYSVQMLGPYANLPHEEAMANAFAFRTLRTELQRSLPHLKTDALFDIERFMLGQPSGYRHYRWYHNGADYIYGNIEMVATLLDSRNDQHVTFEKLLYPSGANFNRYKVPIYIVHH